MWRAAILVLLISALARGAVSGRIDSIGFGSFIRPDCWIPLIIQTTSDEDGPKSFDLQVVQHDLDGDQVIYSRPVTVNPGVQGFWTCFKPEPINGGIPATGSDNMADLGKRLLIFLADPSSGRRITQIATAGNLPQALEFGSLAGTRGQKLILVVGRLPNVNEFSPGSGKLIGTMEDVMFVRVQPQALPVDPLGYEAVDAIVWTDADLDRVDPGQLRAIRQYVRTGGRLVVIQNAESQRMGKLDEFLPVSVGAITQASNIAPLNAILTPADQPRPKDLNGQQIDVWQRVAPPFNIAKATAQPEAIIDTWITWPDKSQTPYIARRLLGNGCVSWIAQDISDPSLTSESFGWPRLWERLMDWHNTDLALPMAFSDDDNKKLAEKYDANVRRDAGAAFIEGINLDKKTAALISVAFFFFIGYWCIAGPASYFLLAAKRRAQWSWFVFGAIALVATLLTVGVTQIVLRGAAEIRHLSLARIKSDGDEPAYVRSRFGLYVPRDGRVVVALAEHDAAMTVAITPLVQDPRYDTREVSSRDSSYVVPIEAEDEAAVTEISVPFRSTLKKLQSTWAGKPTGRITGRPTLLDGDTPLAGQLSNNTGQDLLDVLLVFRWPSASGRVSDQFLALPNWKNGLTIDLAEQWKKASAKPSSTDHGASSPIYGIDRSQRGPLQWAANWIFEDLRSGRLTQGGPTLDDSGSGYGRSFPLVSLFDRFTPMTNLPSENSRVEILRRGARRWDCSAAVAGGALVVLGQADGPIPLPLTVDGETPAGTGHTFFQCIVPMDQSHFTKPPATQPDQQ